MKNISLLTMAIFILSCGQQKTNDQATTDTYSSVSIDFVRTYEGTIGEYPVVVKLRSNSGQVAGTYFYQNKGEELQLLGTIAPDRSLSLEEFDNNDNQTGKFSGQLENDSKITGIWTKPNGKSPMSFTLLASNNDYNTALEGVKNKNRREETPVVEVDNPTGSSNIGSRSFGNSDLSGRYSATSDSRAVLELEMKKLDGNVYRFKVSRDKNGSIVQESGVVDFGNGVKGSYKKDDCLELKFTNERDYLKILHVSCSLINSNSFSGTYYKVIEIDLN